MPIALRRVFRGAENAARTVASTARSSAGINGRGRRGANFRTSASSGSASGRWGFLYSGGVAHEVGTVRMGSDPKTSALNGYCQAHDVKNLFVTDGASFVTNPDKNPTPTILALSWRASDYLLDQAKKLNL